MDPGRVRTGIKWSRIRLMVGGPSRYSNKTASSIEGNLGSSATNTFSTTAMFHEISSHAQEKINFTGYICSTF